MLQASKREKKKCRKKKEKKIVCCFSLKGESLIIGSASWKLTEFRNTFHRIRKLFMLEGGGHGAQSLAQSKSN